MHLDHLGVVRRLSHREEEKYMSEENELAPVEGAEAVEHDPAPIEGAEPVEHDPAPVESTDDPAPVEGE